VALFILAFLPQFADAARGPIWQQILFLGAVFTLTGTCVTVAYGALAGLLRASLATRMSLMNKVAGAMLAILAVRIVTK
jgi:threonine/homoserine/homoserine lactone efflux protein